MIDIAERIKALLADGELTSQEFYDQLDDEGYSKLSQLSTVCALVGDGTVKQVGYSFRLNCYDDDNS